MGPQLQNTTTEKTLYKGSCHCGHISYTVRIDLAAPAPGNKFILSRCNCSYCVKAGSLLAVPVEGSFTLLTPTGGEGALTKYRFGHQIVNHPFCPRCGIATHLGPSSHDAVTRINVLTLDGRVDGRPMEHLRDVKVKYWDGKLGMGLNLGDEPREGGVW
ncbi:hypothetical protein Purlil1_1670 [Purpureocillium lilacinum]|uniref:CENP-V/GFA domain-containing protein n=1 Tax=Purpureocillium lilacinum TaxID=33203 RepID=A0ABR0CDB3_PURLI|nr:hypothetical protein Purlil1_1670 [Purpureocillium lilacinum]